MKGTFLEEALSTVNNKEIFKSLLAANSKINSPANKTIMCSISGGADSDCMLDLITKVDIDKKVRYVWIDTGLGATCC